MVEDKLNKIFNMQYALQVQLGIIKKIKNNPKMRQRYLNQMFLALQEEIIEIMRETAYKNPEFVEFGWKKAQNFNEEKCKEEIIDLIHFVFNLCIALNMGPNEIFDKYINKNKKNYKRQENNY